MDANKVDMFMMANSKFFDEQQLFQIRERLLTLDDNYWGKLQVMQLKDPTTALIISILIGTFGIDRFYIGDTGLGIAKLLTCGGFGIWTLIDWFIIMGAAREKNFEKMRVAVS